jgi:hypothetical protein
MNVLDVDIDGYREIQIKNQMFARILSVNRPIGINLEETNSKEKFI